MTEKFNISILLKALEAFPCLWLKSDPQYRNRIAREAAEDFLLNSFKYFKNDRNFLRKKLRNIRCTYNQETAKIKKSMENNGFYKPKLRWYDEANSFLSKNLDDNLCTSYCTDRDVLEITEETNSEETSDETYSEDGLDLSQNIIQIVLEEEEQNNGVHKVHEHLDKNDKKTKKVEKKKNCDYSNLILDTIKDRVLESVVQSLQEQRLQRSKKSEFALFGECVGKQLEDLPKKDAIRLQMDIQSLICTTRLNLCNWESST